MRDKIDDIFVQTENLNVAMRKVGFLPYIMEKTGAKGVFFPYTPLKEQIWLWLYNNLPQRWFVQKPMYTVMHFIRTRILS